MLSRKVCGHLGYYAVVGNSIAISRFVEEVYQVWHGWLSRRSSHPMFWSRFVAISDRFPLPKPRILWPANSFARANP